MESKYDQLIKLKQLLDCGALTPEEFDAAKHRLLNSEQSSVTPGDQQLPPPSNAVKPSSQKTSAKTWIILGAVGAVIIFVILIIALSGRSDSAPSTAEETLDWAAASEEADAQFEDALAMADEINEDDGLSIGNPWTKNYFTNEWDEPDPSKPMLSTTIGYSYWGIRLDYIPPTEEVPREVFRFLVTQDGKIAEAYGPIEILLRGSDGETKRIEVADKNDYPAYVVDPSMVNALKSYLNNEQFDIKINFGIWNELHNAQGEWSANSGSLQEAIDKLL